MSAPPKMPPKAPPKAPPPSGDGNKTPAPAKAPPKAPPKGPPGHSRSNSVAGSENGDERPPQQQQQQPAPAPAPAKKQPPPPQQQQQQPPPPRSHSPRRTRSPNSSSTADERPHSPADRRQQPGPGPRRANAVPAYEGSHGQNKSSHTSLLMAGDQQPASSSMATRDYPFANADHTVQLLFEITGVNYALYEGLKELDKSRRSQFDNTIHESVWSALEPLGMSPDNIWTQITPGVAHALLLKYDERADRPILVDADWTTRVKVAIRCPQSQSRQVGALMRDFVESGVAFHRALRLLQEWFDRIQEFAHVKIIDPDNREVIVGPPSTHRKTTVIGTEQQPTQPRLVGSTTTQEQQPRQYSTRLATRTNSRPVRDEYTTYTTVESRGAEAPLVRRRDRERYAYDSVSEDDRESFRSDTVVRQRDADRYLEERRTVRRYSPGRTYDTEEDTVYRRETFEEPTYYAPPPPREERVVERRVSPPRRREYREEVVYDSRPTFDSRPTYRDPTPRRNYDDEREVDRSRQTDRVYYDTRPESIVRVEESRVDESPYRTSTTRRARRNGDIDQSYRSTASRPPMSTNESIASSRRGPGGYYGSNNNTPSRSHVVGASSPHRSPQRRYGDYDEYRVGGGVVTTRRASSPIDRLRDGEPIYLRVSEARAEDISRDYY